ncbi:uncharacterized protein [Triticum aestivum]|uniref:uncharacterized protein isoform X2 n=1 Tax=Triticum aestivum TaxID=4565 RepID=UPI001D032EDF|nr:uncharacterized protein LOC123162315 isoform X2 [Triticum aestivum]
MHGGDGAGGRGRSNRPPMQLGGGRGRGKRPPVHRGGGGRETGRGGDGGGRGVAAPVATDESNPGEAHSGQGTSNKGAKKREFRIPFTVEQIKVTNIKHIGDRGRLKMRKPSHCQEMEVILDLQDPSSLYRLRIMLQFFHPNILRCEGLVRDQNSFATFVVPYSGLLSEFLKNVALFNKEYVVPSSELQSIIRQIVEGLDELRSHGYYHGNFSLNNTYYQMEGSKIIVKLANFQQKVNLDDAQIEDWTALGKALETISTNVKTKSPNTNCSLIDDLAQKLKTVKSPRSLPNIKYVLLNEVFFWDKETRTKFAIYTIPKHLSDPTFRDNVENRYKCQIPWDGHAFRGLKAAMNDYRMNFVDKKTYDGNSKFHKLTFLSGCYTHEDELKNYITDNQQSVDRVFQLCDPTIFVDVKKLIP